MHVIVVGAGIAGLSSAWALARRGVQVTLVEQDTVPARRAASNDHQRLLRYGYPDQPGYAHMVGYALNVWQTLWEDLGECHFHETGCLWLSSADGDRSALSHEALISQGIDCDVLEPAALADRFAWLDTSAVREGYLSETGGVLMARKILFAISQHLAGRDVRVLPGVAATRIDLDAGTVMTEDDNLLTADRILVTTGAWSGELSASMAQATSTIRQASLYVEEPDELGRAWDDAPCVVNFGGGQGIYAAPPVDDTWLKFGIEDNVVVDSPDVSRIPKPGEGVALLKRLRPWLKHADDYRITDVRVGCYSVTADTSWVTQIGERGVVLGGCSGHLFKMGALVGVGLAAWAMDDVSSQQLSQWLAGAPEASDMSEKLAQH